MRSPYRRPRRNALYDRTERRRRGPLLILGAVAIVAIALFATGTIRLPNSDDGNVADIAQVSPTASSTGAPPATPDAATPAAVWYSPPPGWAEAAAEAATPGPSRAAMYGDGTGITGVTSVIVRGDDPSADPDNLLPRYRILSYYGQPHDANMGILGEYEIEELHRRLAEQAAAYETADPSRPVKLAFEVIASVAQGDPGPDGTYLLYTDAETIRAYADYAAAHDMLLILDLQIGRHGVANEIEAVRPWLELPHVQLALDPEFAMAEGEQPGEQIGQIDAADVTYAQEALAELAAEKGIPPKILIVHQFHYTMITNKERIAPVAGVQLVVDADGWGPPDLKRETYGVVITQQPIEFHGVKLFYRQDEPLMTPEEVRSLAPVPDLVIYQ